MQDTLPFAAGNYAYIPGPFQYSAGALADPGYAIIRARFARPPSVVEGFQIIAQHLSDAGRPATAFCACELRSPAPFTDQGFIDFNRLYVGTLQRWGIFKDEANPVARSNVCPEIAPPAKPCFHAFCYTVPIGDGMPDGTSFVISGSGEAQEGPGPYAERTIRHGETSADAMREKAAFVLVAMESRMAAIGAGWPDITAAQAYTVHDIHPFLADEVVRRGAANNGLTWHYARPPIVGLDYEMDVRRVPVEILI